MVANNFPISLKKDLPVRPELVEGCTGKSGPDSRQTAHASTSSAFMPLRVRTVWRATVVPGSYYVPDPKG